VKNFHRTDYRGGTQNWNIGQDSHGTMYFANNDGLLEFDGATWRIYKLPNNSAVKSLQIKGSRIYVGGYNQFGYFEPDTKGKLKYISLLGLIKEQNRQQIDHIWKIHCLGESIVFQSFEKNYIYNGKTLVQSEAPNRFQFSFAVGESLIYQDAANGLLEYKNQSFIALPNTLKLNGTEVWGIIPLSKTKLLIATIDHGLFTYENSILAPWNTEANSFILKSNCLGGELIQNGFIVLNSVLDGIIICNKEGRIIQHINRNKGLQNNTVLSSFVDNKNNLWLGLDNGIAFINESSPLTYFEQSYDLSTVYASAVFNHYLYVATNQGLFCHSWDIPFKEDSFNLIEGTTGQAWNIQVIDGQLFCSHNRGMLEISGNKVVDNLDANGYWGLKKIPGKENCYIGANYNGFSIFKKNGKTWKFENSVYGLNKSANSFEVEGNEVWLKKDNQLYRLKLSNDLKKFSSVKVYEALSLQTKGIASIQWLNGKIYFQQANKFFTYAEDQDGFIADKQFTYLFKNLPNVRAISQDKLGNIWYVFNESIGMFRKTDKGKYQNIISGLSNLTGYLVNDYVSIDAVDQNNILIGLTSGLAHFDAGFKNLPSKPKAYIRSFSFPGDTLQIGNNPAQIANYNLPFKANNVKFTFSSPLYENIDNIEFSYFLEGFDEQWSHWTNVSLKEYTNLHEGDYTMHVKARNSFGVQSDPTAFSFTVLPPWYRHWIAYALYLGCFVFMAYYVRRRTMSQIRKNKYYETIEQRKIYLEKEAKIRQEQYDLEKEIERLQNEKLKIKILSKDKELVNNSLQVVKKNKLLNGIISKMKDIDVDSMDEAAKFQFGKLNKSIAKEVHADKSWKDLEKHIRNVHFDFLKRLKEKHPAITPRELDLATYLLMNMSTKEIAEIMNISSGGVELARYRLRKKLNLNKKENLTGFLMSI
jgi:DNA-binding CsgD family transcriptional regulator/ligand-binding sensor domain-containing protein